MHQRAEYLIYRMERDGCRGWIVSTKRAGRAFIRYFADVRHSGQRGALKAARAHRDRLLSKLPLPLKVRRRTYVRNTTGVIGVSRIIGRTKAGSIVTRYVAQWPTPEGKQIYATFSVDRHGEAGALRLAVAARRAGLRKLGWKR